MHASSRRNFSAHASRGMWGLSLLCATCMAGADPGAKVLHLVLPHAEVGFDPATVSESYSTAVMAGIMEPLLTFDYLARPPKLVPLTAESLPDIGGDGRTWTFRIKRGIQFADDAAFNGKRRELTASDYAYAIKRLVDPAIRSPNAFHLAGKIVGLDELAAAARQSNRFDYDAHIDGLQAIDRYTLRIRLEAAGACLRLHRSTAGSERGCPRSGRSIRRAYRCAPGGHRSVSAQVLDSGVAHRARGKPGVSRPRVGFQARQRPPGRGHRSVNARQDDSKHPYRGVPGPRRAASSVARGDRRQSGHRRCARRVRAGSVGQRGQLLAPDLAKRGLRLSRLVDPAITYTTFNMRDPTFGGFGKEQVALRRAIAMAYDGAEEVRIVRRSQAVLLRMPIPPGVPGHSRPIRPFHRAHNPGLANRLLDQSGYRKAPRWIPYGCPAAHRSWSGTRVSETRRLAISSCCGKRRSIRSPCGSSSRREPSATRSRQRSTARTRCGATAGSPTIRTANVHAAALRG